MFGSDFLEECVIQGEEGLAGERQYVPVAARSASHIPWKALGGDAIAAETEKRFDVFKKVWCEKEERNPFHHFGVGKGLS